MSTFTLNDPTKWLAMHSISGDSTGSLVHLVSLEQRRHPGRWTIRRRGFVIAAGVGWTCFAILWISLHPSNVGHAWPVDLDAWGWLFSQTLEWPSSAPAAAAGESKWRKGSVCLSVCLSTVEM